MRRGETFAVLEAVTQRTRQEDQEPDDPARVRITVGTPDAPRPGQMCIRDRLQRDLDDVDQQREEDDVPAVVGQQLVDPLHHIAKRLSLIHI